MAKFKVGDRVRCVDSEGTTCVVFGGEYEVEVCGSKFVNLIGVRGGMYTSRFELIPPTITIEPGKHYRLRNGKVTGRVSTGDIGFEALVDGHVKVFDKAGGAVFGNGEFDIVEVWAPRVGERVVEATGEHYDLVRHWRDYWQNSEGPLTDKSFVVTKIYGEQVHYSNRAGGAGPQIEVRFLEPLLVAAPAQPLRIQQGKFYKTRDGRKVGPAFVNGSIATFGAKDDHRSAVWADNGRKSARSDTTSELAGDIIAEWVDEPVAVAASNDNVAKPKFKVGDRVRVVAAGDAWQEKYKGTTFTIDSDEGDFDGDRSWSGRDHASPYRWKESQLELVPVVVPPAIVALIEDGIGKPSSKPKVHGSQADATTEAERLALAHPGQLFGVFVLADSKIADVVNVPTPVLRAA